jgi:hypothetical protein
MSAAAAGGSRGGLSPLPPRLLHADWHPVTVQAPWVRVFGLVILVGATAFTLSARGVPGIMWSADPRVTTAHQLPRRLPALP